jgi:nitrogen fixation/metabolism regulation signal transduction histidine kinase
MAPRLRRLGSLGELAVLGLVAVAVWLHPLAAATALAAGAALWWRITRRRRERWLPAAALAIAAALEIAAFWTLARDSGSRPTAAELERRYEVFWGDLASAANRAGDHLPTPPIPEAAIGAAFRALAEVAAQAQPPGLALLLLDADRQPVAWAGRGLLQDLTPIDLPPEGAAIRQSYTSASALWVVRLAAGPDRPWWLVAGRTLARAGAAPLAGRADPLGSDWAWVEPAGPPPENGIVLAPPHLPALYLPDEPRPGPGARRLADRFGRVSAGVVAIAFLVLAVFRGVGAAVLSGTVLAGRRRAIGGLLALVAATGVAAAGASPWGASLAALGVLAAAAGRELGAHGAWRGGWLAALALPFGLAIWAQSSGAWATALAGRLAGGGDLAALRLALVGLAFGALAAGSRRSRWNGRDLPLVLAFAGVLAGAAVPDSTIVALALVALAALACGAWIGPRGTSRPLALAGLAIIAALVAAASWETGGRWRWRGEAPAALAALEPPAPEVAARLASATNRDLANAAATLAEERPRLTDRGDLAFALWRRSALARQDALSALVVIPATGPPSRFSYGLPLDARFDLDRTPARWTDLAPESWRGDLVTGESEIELAPGERAQARYWVLPRPGFGPRPARPEELAAGLLRGGPAVHRAAPDFPSEFRFVLYDAAGRIESTPWKERTPAWTELTALGAPPARVATLDGPALVWIHRRADGGVALFLPRLAPLAALERAGVHAAGALLLLALAAAVALVAALPRRTARDLVRRATRSYSRRLVIVYTILLLVPLVLLYAVLAETLGRRLEREQQNAAEAALHSAERVLGEYVLSLQPGFGIGTALDDPLLEWLSRVVQHEVNLYWGSEVYASSKRELFTAGLLPRRIPGEVWERLAVRGEALASLPSRVGQSEYLELYAPLAVPGFAAGTPRLFLAMPLLAQQEEFAAETTRLRRQALLVTLALFLVLAASGVRLAASFTRPLAELVAGTQRIAAGAERLDLRPEEEELTALAEAIDRMARHIAEGRRQLVQEKQLVEGIVENVTAGIVCLDRDRRVLLANRFARTRLGVEPGQPIAAALGEREALAPVAAFAGGAGWEPARASARVTIEGQGERDWELLWVPVVGGGEPTSLLVVEDVTEVVRAQRLEAWVSMARIIAHEIKNPLTPIRLSAEHLRDTWTRDRAHFESVLDRCLTNILNQVEELREIATDFSIYSRLPSIDRKPGDLVASLREIVDAYRAAPPPGVSVEWRAGAAEIPARFDGRLLGRALRNLIENAVRASAAGGRVEVAVEPLGERARISVRDAGNGVAPALLERIFEPYFSTHAGGTGLGLPIARRIVEEHGGALTARNPTGGGFEVEITMPLS